MAFFKFRLLCCAVALIFHDLFYLTAVNKLCSKILENFLSLSSCVLPNFYGFAFKCCSLMPCQNNKINPFPLIFVLRNLRMVHCIIFVGFVHFVFLVFLSNYFGYLFEAIFIFFNAVSPSGCFRKGTPLNARS